MKSNCKDVLLNQLSLCGQIAEHKSTKMQENGVDDSKVLASLTDEEKQSLASILTKLQAQWLEGHKAHFSK